MSERHRPAHFHDYPDASEVVPGVFVIPGDSVYIVDDDGEVVMWNLDEWAEDQTSVTAAICACILAAVKGAKAVRQNIADKGATLTALIDETDYKVSE
jgi:hypothetical protein